MNNVNLIGRLVKNPELRYNKSNIAIASFTIAINRQFKNENGEYETDFIFCKAFNKRAETISKYCKKGDLIGIEGSIRTGSYEKDDKKHYTTEISVNSVHFLSNNTNSQEKEKQAETGAKNKPEGQTSEEVYAEFGDSIEIDDSELAF